MKRLIGLSICALILIGLQAFINCSTPLESADLGNPSPPPPGDTDTVYLHDTVFSGDTLFITDTIEVTDSIYLNDTLYVTDTLQVIDTLSVIDTFYVSDTIMVVDTVSIVDTTYVEVPGEDCPFKICSYISSYYKKIYWRFPDLNGQYEFKFSRDDLDNWYRGGDDDDDGHGDNDNCDGGKNCPLKKLKIHINNKVYFWNVGDNKNFILNLNVEPNTVVKIFPYTSKWCRHKLDVCLKVSPL